ncbi:alpha/beta fold hydrolase [Armatimonas rosea]|uniref:Pimeloyl-ACP methyl ester carboxylesterase n=1 Tax=Armatimonas rosea TaxID=685828 RepID=A0A7W9SL50_ARMRO|nr:pimeloyl-ACP methyl ester carboxylesterase [Armatimonas rosea]
MKKTAVLIHGAGGGGWEYTLWEPVFRKAGWRTLAPDLVPAASGLEQTQLSDYVGQVLAAVPKDAAPLVFIGASMGGLLALAAAAQRKPAALVLVNSVPPKGVPWPRTESKPSPPVVRWANGPLQETRDSMPDSDEKTIQFAWKRWRDESGAVLNTLHAGVELPNPSCPTLVVIGERDTDIPPETSVALATRLHADLHRYAGMSHVGPLLSTRAPEVAAATERWLTVATTRENRR